MVVLDWMREQYEAGPLLHGAVILGVTLLAMALVRFVVIPGLRRAVRNTASTFDDEVLDRLSPVLVQTVLLVGLRATAAGFLTTDRWDGLMSSVLVTLLVWIWGRFALDVGTVVFFRLSRVGDRFTWVQPTSLPLVQFAYKVLVVGTVLYLLLSAWHLNLTSWLASAGVVGIAVGFAAKDTLANFISGIVILMDAPYKVGEYVVIDGATRGEVTDIGMRSTRILTRDNVEVTVPNAIIGNAMIVNQSSGPTQTLRVRVGVGVAYGSDIDQVRQVLASCTEGLPHTDPSRKPSIRFNAMGESSLDFLIMVWVSHPQYRGRVVDELNMRIYKVLDEAGIEIPFPQRDLRLKEWPAGRLPGQEEEPSAE
ncbi:MAG: mechanosensitive ion channel family protein [bacterium]|nr:mechanosensitive ion channel family protein [bacterium]